MGAGPWSGAHKIRASPEARRLPGLTGRDVWGYNAFQVVNFAQLSMQNDSPELPGDFGTLQPMVSPRNGSKNKICPDARNLPRHLPDMHAGSTGAKILPGVRMTFKHRFNSFYECFLGLLNPANAPRTKVGRSFHRLCEYCA
jgi:hypothetical protein